MGVVQAMAQLDVTSVSVRLFSAGDDKLKAFASIVINNAFIIKDLKIIEGSQGRFVAMPSRRGRDGVFRDVAHPLNQEARNAIEQVVLQAYNAEIMKGSGAARATAGDVPDYHHH